jgi:glutaredoxin-like protein
MEEKSITVYGTRWCGDCFRTRKLLERNRIVYNWVDIDNDESGEEFVLSTNHGMRSVPTIVFEDGSILVEPTAIDLQEKLEIVLKSI